MPLTRIPDLAYQIDGDSIYIEQNSINGAEKVELHRMHLAHLAREMGLLHAGIDSRTERALLRLWAKLELLTSGCFLDEIVERCSDGLTYQTFALDALNIMLDLLEDFEIEAPTYEGEKAARAQGNEKSSNDKSGDAGISVTQSGRGRPSTGQAMTNAERQARHRAKQADLLAEGGA